MHRSPARAPTHRLAIPSALTFLIVLIAAPASRLAGQTIGAMDPFNHPGVSPPFGQITSPAIRKEIRLAGDYLIGRGVPRDPVQAAYWYRKAADQGDPDAQNQLGYLSMWGIGVPRDEAVAFRWFARATGEGSQGAKLNLAVLYFKGVGTPRDRSLALELMTQLAERGNARAQAYLGIVYLTGDGFPKDLALAEKWLKRAAKGKNPEAEYSMGVLWSTTAGHEHDPAKAIRYYRKAARDGYVPAMHALGVLLEQHPEIPANSPDEAITMLERAAQAGSWASSVVLATLARDGHERPRSLADAFRWFMIATRQGGSAAQQFIRRDLDRCRQSLTEDQQNRERAEADAWMEQHPHTDLFLLSGLQSSDFPIDEIYAPGPAGQ